MTTELKLITIKKASCPTLSRSGFVDYQISRDDKGVHYIGLTGNSGNGYFSKTCQPVTTIMKALEDFEAEFPITSLAFKDLYPDTSINSWSFLMAALLQEGLVEPHPDHLRRFRLTDTETFLAGLEKLDGAKQSHSASRRRKARPKD